MVRPVSLISLKRQNLWTRPDSLVSRDVIIINIIHRLLHRLDLLLPTGTLLIRRFAFSSDACPELGASPRCTEIAVSPTRPPMCSVWSVRVALLVMARWVPLTFEPSPAPLPCAETLVAEVQHLLGKHHNASILHLEAACGRGCHCRCWPYGARIAVSLTRSLWRLEREHRLVARCSRLMCVCAD